MVCVMRFVFQEFVFQGVCVRRFVFQGVCVPRGLCQAVCVPGVLCQAVCGPRGLCQAVCVPDSLCQAVCVAGGQSANSYLGPSIETLISHCRDCAPECSLHFSQ